MSDRETEDAEANLFATELLVPRPFLEQAVKDMGGVDLANDKQVKKLAEIFKVPVAIMAIRLQEIYCDA